ncbi:hypothetical protein L4N02_27120 [Klebsiella variicola]|uniref:hypothetical protein n=1 Tax=Klebsiella variicola TaxID=244366 RepID=UPI001F264D36|nr:hypothetical protein [Klebsiella variicola]MCF7065514.1 hypothetical protein [Klebsiella variicola]MCF7098382.1 hypothetical protein [Klebsiella variicola]
MTTDITELALIAKIKSQLENFDTVVLKEGEAVALVEALEKAQQRISELESPTFTFEVTAEPFTCPRCGTTTTHPEGWHYCHKREGE